MFPTATGYTPPKTLLTELHDVQILTFMEGQGIEFYPFSDVGGVRKAYLDDLVERNRLDLKIRLAAHWMMKTGGVLLYLRPTGRSYDIRFYDRDGYRVYKDADGDIEEAWIQYAYPKRSQQQMSPFGGGGALPTVPASNASNEGMAWVKICLTKELFRRWDNQQKTDWKAERNPDIEAENSLGFIPCVECLNLNNKGEQGKPEYQDLEKEIYELDALEEGIRTNIGEFSSSPLITSLREDQIFDSGVMNKDSVALASGYHAAPRSHLNPLNLFNMNGIKKRIKRVIGGFSRGGDGEPGDFISQVQINPLPPNQLGYVTELSRKIRKALGGRDESEVTYSATEVRSQMGEVSATAAMKERSLFKYGFCELLSMALLAEENLYLATGGQIGLATAPYQLNRKVKYRKAPIFIQSSREKLDNSIIGRNNARAGVNQLESLKDIFPDKSEEEIKAMLKGGLPTEYLRDMVGIFSMMQSIIDPATNAPLTASIPIAQYILNALAYGQPDNIDLGTSGATANLESDSFAAAQRTAAKLNLSGKPTGDKPDGQSADANANGVSAKPGSAADAKRPNSVDAEQSLPSSTGTLNDTNGNSNGNANTYSPPS